MKKFISILILGGLLTATCVRAEDKYLNITENTSFTDYIRWKDDLSYSKGSRIFQPIVGLLFTVVPLASSSYTI